MDWLLSPQTLIAFLTLLALELVLGIDNIVFISILAGRLPREQQNLAIRLGLGAALLTRILLLLMLSWIIGLTAPLFQVLGQAISGRDLILLAGGLFLLFKATREIHHKLEGDQENRGAAAVYASFGGVIVQIMLLDIVFSIDSVVTAVGMVSRVEIMIAAIMVAIIIVMFFATRISNFVHQHPTVKMLALSFLLLIGTTLIAEGFHHHIPKGYIYFAIAFAALVEVLNLRMQAANGKAQPVHLHEPYLTKEGVPLRDRPST
jgi:predicted tellurium resistance membrane protein TerC